MQKKKTREKTVTGHQHEREKTEIIKSLYAVDSVGTVDSIRKTSDREARKVYFFYL